MLAICIKNGWIRYAQVDIEDQSFVLNQLDQSPLSPELRSISFHSPEFVVQLQELFQQIIASLSIPDHEVFLSLGDEWIDCHIQDIDNQLSTVENEAYLNWVIKQRQGILWEDTITFFQIIDSDESDTIKIWACATKEYVVEGIKEALVKSGCSPIWLEPSVQSILRVLTNTGDISKVKSIVVEPSGNFFRAQFHDGGQLQAIAPIKFQSGKFSDTFVRGDKGFVDLCLSDFNNYMEKKELQSDLRVFLVGEFSERHLSMLLQKKTKQNIISIVNPFLQMKKGEIELPSVANGSWFVEILGLMQRRMASA